MDSLEIVHQGYVRTVGVWSPMDYDYTIEVTAPLAVILVLGDPGWSPFTAGFKPWKSALWHDTVVIYVTPVVTEVASSRLHSGHVLGSDHLLDLDELDFCARALVLVRERIAKRVAQRAALLSAVAKEVFDFDRIYLFGYRYGGPMAYALARAAPLVWSGDPEEIEWTFRAVAMYGGTVGGYEDDLAGAPFVDHSPAPMDTAVGLSILHIQGDLDVDIAPPGGVAFAVSLVYAADDRIDFVLEYGQDRWVTFLNGAPVALTWSAPTPMDPVYAIPPAGVVPSSVVTRTWSTTAPLLYEVTLVRVGGETGAVWPSWNLTQYVLDFFSRV